MRGEWKGRACLLFLALREMVSLPRSSYGQYHYCVARLMEPMLITQSSQIRGFSKPNPVFASELATCQKLKRA
jgi:hypothetical protein